MINKNIEHIQNKRMENNTFIIHEKNYALIVDPSWNCKEIVQIIKKINVDKIDILLTHTHFDHCSDTGKLCEELNISFIYLSKFAKQILKKETSRLFFNFDTKKYKDKFVFVDEHYKNQSLPDLTIILTPGHSVCSICVRYKDVFITGDTLFIYDIGRTDLLFSDKEEMKKSLKKLYFYLINEKQNLLVCPGHGEFNLKEYVLKKNLYINR